MKKKHILVISQYFYPEQFRINDLCTEWVKKGYKVTVLTGIPNYPQGSFFAGYGLRKKRKEIYNGVNIIRIPIIPRGKRSLTLALNYLSFVMTGFLWKLFTRIKADYVFIFEVSPMTQALPGVWYAKKLGIPCNIYVQDLWPENLQIMGIDNKFILRMVDKMVGYIYKSCNNIFVTSESFKKSVSQRKEVEESKVKFWPQYAEDFYKPLKKNEEKNTNFNNKLKVIFTGNIGYAQGLDILPKVADLIKQASSSSTFQFIVVGDGRYKQELIKQVQENSTDDMFDFVPRQNPEKIPELLAQCDVAFLSFSSNDLFSKTIPAKLQSYMACGMPIIASVDGESERIIKKADAGMCSPTGNVVELYENIMKMSMKSKEEIQAYGKNALDYYSVHYSKEKLLKEMDYYFES
ncbi:glycosyltransferase family 4 protein [Oceanobacillus oncorhynchi]|uniref:glycosyltransferase family 4 protein n=1 Tax=Oceanobacillus oncorhynchi TaxID=545501 RepID=UPI001867BC20|nr:glycosyltransferase family 4 protein [Oceanobacillus oncorhynchi]